MRKRTTDERLSRAASFNEDAEAYNRARPHYPVELFEALWRLAELGSHPDVVEVGCGTGQASVSLAAHGAKLTGIEFGPNMAAVARRNLAGFPSAQVIVSKFEDWDNGGKLFDLVFASSSWHWIDPDVRYAKAGSILKPRGSIAIVNSAHIYPEGYDKQFDRIQDVYAEVTGSRRELAPFEMPPHGTLDENDVEHIEQMNLTGQFEDVQVERFLWHLDRTADGFVELLGTFSDNWALEPETRDRLFERIRKIIAASPAGTIRKHYLSTLRLARRR
jgi:SAM-dependent methyltransferase